MTTAELRDRVRVTKSGYGQYEVRIMYRGKEYRCHSTNSLAYDRLDDADHGERWEKMGYNNKRAWQAFYDECKRKNSIM